MTAYRLHHQAGRRQHSVCSVSRLLALTYYTAKPTVISTPSALSLDYSLLPPIPPSRPSLALRLLCLSTARSYLLYRQAGRRQHSVCYLPITRSYLLHRQAGRRQHSVCSISRLLALTIYTAKPAVVSTPSAISRLLALTSYTAKPAIVSSPSTLSLDCSHLQAIPPSRPSSVLCLLYLSTARTYILHRQTGCRQYSVCSISRLLALTYYTTKPAVVSTPSNLSLNCSHLLPIPPNRPSLILRLLCLLTTRTYILHHQAGYRQYSVCSISRLLVLTIYTAKPAVVSTPSTLSLDYSHLHSTPPNRLSSVLRLLYLSTAYTYRLYHQSGRRQYSVYSMS